MFISIPTAETQFRSGIYYGKTLTANLLKLIGSDRLGTLAANQSVDTFLDFVANICIPITESP